MKKHVSLLLMALMSVSLVLDGHDKGDSGASGTESQAGIQTEVQTEAETGNQTIIQSGDKTTPDQASESPSGESSPPAPKSDVGGELDTGSGENRPTRQAAIRVSSLKGPTSMGLVPLMGKTSEGETSNVCEFTMTGKANELVGKITNGNLGIVLVPANVANVLCTEIQEDITVLDINTLGVLYVVASNDSIIFMAGLKGRTIYMTGKGTTPEYVMNYFLKENGLSASNVDLQFKSEATEVVSLLKQDSSTIGVLPQPFTTAACIQNPDLKTVLDLAEQWSILNKNSKNVLMTGIALVRGDFLRENRSPVADFIKDHEASTLFAKEHTEDAAQLIVKQGIVGKAPIAQKALSYCNIVCLTRQEMKNALSGCPSTLNGQGPRPIDGQMPRDDFYCTS